MIKDASSKIVASFVHPMLALSASSLPEGPEWEYELKLDGYRALAIKTGRQVQLRSRNDKDFRGRFPGVVAIDILNGTLEEAFRFWHSGFRPILDRSHGTIAA